jgi:hypothetical protein
VQALAHSPRWHVGVVFDLRTRWALDVEIEGRRPLSPKHEVKRKDVRVRAMREGQQ